MLENNKRAIALNILSGELLFLQISNIKLKAEISSTTSNTK